MMLEAVLDMAIGMLLEKPSTWYKEGLSQQPFLPSHHQSSEVKERTPTADPSSITSFLRLEAKNEHLDLYRHWGRLEYRLDIWLTSMRQNLHLLLSFIHAIQPACLKNYPLQKFIFQLREWNVQPPDFHMIKSYEFPLYIANQCVSMWITSSSTNPWCWYCPRYMGW